MVKSFSISILLLLLLLLSCTPQQRQRIQIPAGQTYISPNGVEVYIPTADTIYLSEIFQRVDNMPVEQQISNWTPQLRGLPSGWSWVLMGEGPFTVQQTLVTGWTDQTNRRVFVSTYLLSGAYYREHGFSLLPAGPHEAAHAWSQGTFTHP